jgi:hypothetical protein
MEEALMRQPGPFGIKSEFSRTDGGVRAPLAPLARLLEAADVELRDEIAAALGMVILFLDARGGVADDSRAHAG